MRRIYLRQPGPLDQEIFLAAVRRSRALHRPWVRPPASPQEFVRFIDRLSRPENYGFLVCTRAADALAGVVNITNVVLGVFGSGYLSYYAFAGFEGRGLMREGVRAVVRHAFSTLKLHRLEANIQPQNAASIALVQSCGFRREGYSPRFLKIGGRWRDHERWAILAS